MSIIRLKVFVLSILFFALSFISLKAQMETGQVEWKSEIVKTGDNTAELRFVGKIKDKWHIYGLNIPDGGPTATAVKFETLKNVKPLGSLYSIPKEEVYRDKAFDMDLSVLHGNITLVQKVEVSDFQTFAASGYIKYMACTDETCTPPQNWDFSIIGSVNGEAASSDATKVDSVATSVTNTLSETMSGGDLWKPVIDQLASFGDKNTEVSNMSVWILFLTGFAGGLIALLTPCVWPMIPMTVSFFLKRSKDRKKGIKDAITYGLGIIIIYLALGLIITGIFGPSALNKFATDKVVNIIFFLLLVFFAVSFFGAFEIVLPAKWTSKMDSKADSTTGFVSIMFMSFTLALVSFSCTGPIIGTLLVQAVSMGSYFGPAVGMFGFAFALALPFTLFAIFPSWLQSMPKSGGWLNSVKVVLAFLELALSLKFLSVADLAYGWRILDREVFVALWIIIFALLGLYLLGKIRFPHDSPKEHTSILGLFLAIISLSFSVYMVPGLWGAPLRAISAFAPPLRTQDFNLYNGEVHAKFDDYEAGMEYAKKVGKPVLIDFSGFGCVNCRNMEADVWTDPKVKDIIDNKYVLITLIVDDKQELGEPIVVNENGKEKKLRTIGDKWSYLQATKFGANIQPYYVLLDNDGNPLEASRSYDRDIDKYIKFLNSGLENYKKR